MTAAAGSQAVAVATGHGGCSGLAGRRRRAFGRRERRRDGPMSMHLGPELPQGPRSKGVHRVALGDDVPAGYSRWRRGGLEREDQCNWRKDGRVRDGARWLMKSLPLIVRFFAPSSPLVVAACAFCVATDNLRNQPGAASAASRQRAEMQRARADLARSPRLPRAARGRASVGGRVPKRRRKGQQECAPRNPKLLWKHGAASCPPVHSPGAGRARGALT